jgi:hypothetical protein
MKTHLRLMIAVALFGASSLAFAAGTPAAAGAAKGQTAAKADADALAKARAEYPLQVCAVSNEELGSMGEPFEHVHKEAGKPDRLVRMCCKGCLKTFNRDPAKYLGRIDSAAKKKESGDKNAGGSGPGARRE